MQRTLAQATFWILVVSSSHASRTNYRTLIALLEKESRDLARDRAMVLLSLKAGGCIRKDDTVIELIRTKGGKPRSVPINKELRLALQAYRAESRRTFATQAARKARRSAAA